MILIPVTGLTKDDLRSLVALRGKGNDRAIRIDGQGWSVGCLVYRRLRAARKEDGYAGVHEFETLPDDSPAMELADFDAIPGLTNEA